MTDDDDTKFKLGEIQANQRWLTRVVWWLVGAVSAAVSFVFSYLKGES